jgi:hypothetical protein
MHRYYATSWDTIQLKSQIFQVERPHLPFLRYEEKSCEVLSARLLSCGDDRRHLREAALSLPHRRVYMAQIA